MSTTNGSSRTYEQVRADLKRARAERSLALARYEQRVLEHFGTGLDWVVGPNYPGGFHSGPGNVPGPHDGWYGHGRPGGGRLDYQDGHNHPFAWSEMDLEGARGYARWLEATNPLAQGAIRTLTNFTIKTGFTWECVPAPGLAQDAEAVAVARMAQAVVEEFADLNGWAQLERSQFWESRVDGEVFLRSFAQDDGTTVVAEVLPEQVIQPLGSPPQCWGGIETEPGNVLKPKSYYVSYADPNDWEAVPADEISHLKLNVRRVVKRGMTDFYCCGTLLEGAYKLLRNMQHVGAIQAAIPWIEQFTGATRASVQAKVAGAIDQLQPFGGVDPWTNKATNSQRFLPGDIPQIGAGKEYLPAPLAGNTTQHVSILGAGQRAGGTRWNMPEYMISGDASNANYSSTLVAGSPFVTGIECEQVTIYKPHYMRVLWIALRNAARAGRFALNGRRYDADDVQRLVDLQCTPPQVAIANKGEEATVDGGDMDRKVISPQERARRRGVDPDVMAREIAEWNRKFPEQPPQQPQPGQGVQEAKSVEYHYNADGLVTRTVERVLEAAPGDETAEENPDAFAEMMADILFGLYGEDALSFLVESNDDEPEDTVAESRVREAWNALDHPRGKNGRFIPRGSPEAVAAATEAVAAVLKGDKSPESAEKVMEHLSILTVKQLQQLHRQHGVKAPGRLRAQLVEGVKARLTAGKEKEPEAKVEEPKETPAAKEPHEMTKAEAGTVDKHPHLSVPDKLYHGTRRGFEGKPREGWAEGWGRGIYFATDPNEPKNEFGHGGRVLEYFGDFKKPLDAGGEEYRRIIGQLEEENRAEQKRLQAAADSNPDDDAAWNALEKFRVFDPSERDFVQQINDRIRSLGYDAIVSEHPTYGKEVVALNPESLMTPEEAHRHAVEQALAAGKSVPPEVLADYPDLAGGGGTPAGAPKAPAEHVAAVRSHVDGVIEKVNRAVDDARAQKLSMKREGDAVRAVTQPALREAAAMLDRMEAEVKTRAQAVEAAKAYGISLVKGTREEILAGIRKRVLDRIGNAERPYA